ncbi:PTS fructose transporter subunit IIABC [Nocardioides jiangxiensis]|uniref:Fructose-specific PTS transporter subunit EIIC n=1 Tax=Nocardioides jiangxiensis TaxID=3064524 RepID=A0ABT9B3E6_9ACTN|nr:fructose-specific PTS transporter subunit EIIC [Nocardioides sp. WY-20]MDO7869242.1 fructose-specific PTS transporter subunit EIIC [Nocardioides sp. WY-20]
MNQLINHDLVVLDVAPGPDKEAVIRSLVGLVAATGRSTDQAQLEGDVLAREATSPTGLKGGIAIPHCRTTGVSEPTLAFARLNPAVDFGAKDGPADLAFLIAVPDGGDADHLTILTKLARALVRKEFAAELRTATSVTEVVDLVRGVLEPAPAPAEAAPAASPAQRTLVAVTACPTGIAHTYLAAEALQAAAERAGVRIDVETQGSAGSTPLPASTIAAASAVILATDVGVRDKGRFAGLPVVASGVKRAVDDADAMIAEALRYADDPAAPRVTGTAGDAQAQTGAEESWGARVRRILMTGVSYMIPFVAAGGLLIAIGFLLGGYDVALPFAKGSASTADDVIANNSITNLPDVAHYGVHTLGDSGLALYLGALLFKLGALSFGFLVPALAGYIAFAIADRPGIAPGFVMGAVSGVIGAGFLGGIVGGVLAGLVAHWLASRKVPAWARGLMPVLVIPLLTTVVAGLVMLVLLARPLGSLMSHLNDGLTSMSGGSAVVLGVVLGLMMAFDMGGPLNKVAYGFATAGLGAAATSSDAPQLKIMAAVMLAGMVPPIALALATVVRPGLFSTAERENGKAAWLMGASFITEGAIPFAAADPLRVIPSIMVGSAITGGLSEAFGVSLRAPHGGVFVLFAVDGILGFAIALAAGVVAAAACVITLKSFGGAATQPAEEPAAVPA